MVTAVVMGVQTVKTTTTGNAKGAASVGGLFFVVLIRQNLFVDFQLLDQALYPRMHPAPLRIFSVAVVPGLQQSPGGLVWRYTITF
jgi:hypothetical protein